MGYRDIDIPSQLEGFDKRISKLEQGNKFLNRNFLKNLSENTKYTLKVISILALSITILLFGIYSFNKQRDIENSKICQALNGNFLKTSGYRIFCSVSNNSILVINEETGNKRFIRN